MMQVGLGGIERVAGGPVSLIDAHVPEKGISGVADQQKVTPLAHVAVVVDPFLGNGGLVQRQRRVNHGPATQGPGSPIQHSGALAMPGNPLWQSVATSTM